MDLRGGGRAALAEEAVPGRGDDSDCVEVAKAGGPDVEANYAAEIRGPLCSFRVIQRALPVLVTPRRTAAAGTKPKPIVLPSLHASMCRMASRSCNRVGPCRSCVGR
jgi:hypothetical protein